jgi:cellulose synthase/poly-beta-1,6-N-acetylglucosamine synthase-like glycosyltransferase
VIVTAVTKRAATPGVSVGVFAHNEEATIAQVVRKFLTQTASTHPVREIIVVCCGCTDRTVPAVCDLAASEPRVRVLVRPRREGKVAAINEFVVNANCETLVLASGDVFPSPDLVHLLAEALAADPLVLMAGPRVVAAPMRRPRAVDRLHSLLWELHHAVSVRGPKLGEIVAVRRAVLGPGLPASIHCDEALMEAVVTERGGRLRYVSAAVAYNFPPIGVGALYSQRRRIAAQHLLLRRLRGYRPTTTELRHVLSAVNTVVTGSAGRWPLVGVLAAMESVARLHGRLDVRRGRDYRLWHVSQTRQSLAGR